MLNPAIFQHYNVISIFFAFVGVGIGIDCFYRGRIWQLGAFMKFEG